MNRRDSLKALAVGTVSVGTILATSCDKKDSKNQETGASTTGEKLSEALKKIISSLLSHFTFKMLTIAPSSAFRINLNE